MARTRATSRMNIDSQTRFATIPSVKMPRSKFDRSHGLKTTLSEGYLVPIYVDEALPGDTFSCQPATFARMATPLHPLMDSLQLDLFFFAVPIRLLWENWQRFNGEQDNPGDSTDYVVPTVGPGALGQAAGSLWDYLGLPITTVSEPDVCAFWHRAYNLIYKEWFRDESLVDSPPINKGDGPDTPADYVLLKRGKRKDYFTSALPWPQKGPAVELPLGTSAPLNITGTGSVAGAGDPTVSLGGTGGRSLGGGGTNALLFSGASSSDASMTWDDPALSFDGTQLGGTADLSTATAATINQIRQAFQIQKLYERDARGGTRYTEILQAHFGVTSPDQRLQRPEYLGGGSAQITINPVAQTSNTVSSGDDASAQGNLAAFATSVAVHNRWIKSFTEHCVLLGLVSIRADLNYQQNLPRMFSRSTRWDFYWPSLAHIGEQAVLNKEIYYIEGDSENEDVWGYQERWAEYRYKPSQVTGKMRSNVSYFTTSLDTWHLAQDFGGTRPYLNSSFIAEQPPVSRVIAVDDEPHFLLDCYFNLQCVRPMPVYSVPGLVDHF